MMNALVMGCDKTHSACDSHRPQVPPPHFTDGETEASWHQGYKDIRWVDRRQSNGSFISRQSCFTPLPGTLFTQHEVKALCIWVVKSAQKPNNILGFFCIGIQGEK